MHGVKTHSRLPSVLHFVLSPKDPQTALQSNYPHGRETTDREHEDGEVTSKTKLWVYGPRVFVIIEW